MISFLILWAIDLIISVQIPVHRYMSSAKNGAFMLSWRCGRVALTVRLLLWLCSLMKGDYNAKLHCHYGHYPYETAGSLIPAMPRSLQGRKQYYHPAHGQIPGPWLILDRPGENGSLKGCPGVLSTGWKTAQRCSAAWLQENPWTSYGERK